MKNLETELHCRGHRYFMPHCADCHNLDRARILAEFNHLQALIDGASAELPKLKVEMFKAAGDGRVFASVLEWQSSYSAWKQLAHMIAGDTFDIPQTVAIAAIAKERALRKAAEETMVYQHKGLEEETTLRETAEAELATARADAFAECANICRDIDMEYASVFAEACAEAIERAAKRTP